MDQSFLSIFPILVILLVLSQVVFLYLIAKALQDRKNEIDKEEMIIKQTKEQSAAILGKAVEDANKVLMESQNKGVEILDTQKKSGEAISAQFGQYMATIEQSLKSQLEKNAQEAEGHYGEFLRTVEDSITRQIQRNNAMLEEKSSQMIEKTQALLDSFVADVQGRVRTQIDKELTAVRDEIEQYKLHRMQVIDERIIEMLEDILRVALEKKLSLAEQSELVYRALEEAKRENAFMQ